MHTLRSPRRLPDERLTRDSIMLGRIKGSRLINIPKHGKKLEMK
jgi:hypothetical protein